MRKQLPAYADIELLVDFRVSTVFTDAQNSPAIIIATRRGTPQAAVFAAVRFTSKLTHEQVLNLLPEIATETHTAITEKIFHLSEHFDTFPESSEHLQRRAWYLMPAHERAVFEALATAKTHWLEELTLTRSGGFQGLKTGFDSILVLRVLRDEGDDVLTLAPKGGGSQVGMERAVLRPWLFGRDVERWHIAWDGWYVFFPYVQIDEKYCFIPTTETRMKFDHSKRADYPGPFLDENYPYAWNYLKEHETQLRSREGGRYRRGRREEHLWYDLARPQNLDYYELPKVLIQELTPSADVAVDDVGRYFFAGARIYGLALEPSFDTAAMTALLNSRPMDFYFKHISAVYVSSGSYSYSDQFIKDLPIRLPQNQREKTIAEKLAALAHELTETKGQLRRTECERATFPEPLLPELGPVELYPLRQLVAGTPQAQTIRVEEASFQPQLDRQWAMTFGRTTLLFPSEAHARLAETWLLVQGRATVRTDDLLAVRVPTSDEDCQRLLELLAAQEAEIERLTACISDCESEVDVLVAELYGLDKEAMQVVEEFLERF